MQAILLQRIQRAFNLSFELFSHLQETSLSLKLADLPSNKIGEQVWCMIGARESYLKAAEEGHWAGFTCSLQNTNHKKEVLAQLESSADEVLQYLQTNKLDETQLALMMDLLEHELVHHGQVIRYIYGNKLSFPKSWNERYTV